MRPHTCTRRARRHGADSSGPSSLAVFTYLGSRRKPQRGVRRLHHSPSTRSSFADGFSTSLDDGIDLMTIRILLSEPFALYLPAQFTGYPLHESQVALPEPGICFVTHAAQRAVWTPIGKHNRHSHVGAYVCLASHPQILRQIFAPGVGHHVREATVEHSLAVGLIEWEAFPFSPSEGARIPLQRAEDQLVPGELRDEGDVHLQVLPDQGEQALYLLRWLVKPTH